MPPGPQPNLWGEPWDLLNHLLHGDPFQTVASEIWRNGHRTQTTPPPCMRLDPPLARSPVVPSSPRLRGSRRSAGPSPAWTPLATAWQPHTKVMTFRAAGWNLRILFFRALEALTRQSLGTGGRGGLEPAGARGGSWGAAPAQAGPLPPPCTQPSESLLPDSASPKRLAVWSLASSSLVSAMVEWKGEVGSEPPDSLLAWASWRGSWGLALAHTGCGPPPLLTAGLWGPGLGSRRGRAEISAEDRHRCCFLLGSPPAATRGAASRGNKAWVDAR